MSYIQQKYYGRTIYSQQLYSSIVDMQLPNLLQLKYGCTIC